MKRNVAKNKMDWLIYGEHREIKNDVIDQIYDDFESRTCENCKYCKEVYNDVTIHGNTMLSCELGIYYKVPDGFGCNKWEAK